MIKIAIPSKQRAWKIETLNFLKDVKCKIYIFVEPQEFKEYKEVYKDENIKVVSIKENDKWIWYARKFMLDYLNWVVLFLDDDINKLKKWKTDLTSFDEIIQVMLRYIDKIPQVWIDTLTYNWGRTKKCWLNQKIIQVTMLNLDVLKKHNIQYDERLRLFEDVDLFIQLILKWFSNLKLYIYAADNYSFLERTKTKKRTWAWLDWDNKSNEIVAILKDKYPDLIEVVIDKQWYTNFKINKKKLWLR